MWVQIADGIPTSFRGLNIVERSTPWSCTNDMSNSLFRSCRQPPPVLAHLHSPLLESLPAIPVKTGGKYSAWRAVAVGDKNIFRHTTWRYTGRGRNQGQQDAGKVRVPRPAGEKNNAADVSIYASCNAGTPQQPRRFDS